MSAAKTLPASRFSVALTKGRAAFIDEADWPLVGRHRWKASFRKSGRKWYAVRTINGKKTIYMHREILGHPESSIDHIDGNGLNNTRANLRLCNHKQNCANQLPRLGGTSAFKGVSWETKSKRWRAQIKTSRKSRHLGYFKSQEEAAAAYAAAAHEIFGEFARGGAA